MEYLKSRTVWTLIVLVLVNSIEANKSFIPDNFEPIIDSVLALLAIYFRSHPRV